MYRTYLDPQATPAELVDYLVRHEVLTLFQAECLKRDRGRELTLWTYTLVDALPAGSTGTQGQNGTVILCGPDSDFYRFPSAGGRFTAGVWVDEDRRFGLESNYFFLAPRGNHFAAAGDGSPAPGPGPVLASAA